MILPRRGLLYDASGRIIWAWEHNDPTSEFDSLPPMRTDSAGRVTSMAPPDAVVLDLEAVLRQGDIDALYKDMHACRIRRTRQGTITFKKIIGSGADAIEIDHPLQTILDARRPQLPGPPLAIPEP